jgi:hypothetical protein
MSARSIRYWLTNQRYCISPVFLHLR